MQDQTASILTNQLNQVETQLADATMEISLLQRQLADRERQAGVALKEVTARKDQIEEEVTRYENQDRVIREKCIHLEGQARKAEK